MTVKYWLRSIVGLSALLSIALFPFTANAGGDVRYSRPSPPPFSWGGAYAGLQIGYSWDQDSDIPNDSSPSTSNDGPLEYYSVVGGVHLGYNIRQGRYIFGIEGDFELAPGSGNDDGRNGDINGLETNWTASLRARLGYIATRSTMFYLTGGWAFLDGHGTSSAAGQGDVSTDFNGWTIGTGLERIVDNMTTVRLEYRYTDFDVSTENYATAGYRLGFEPEIHSIRIGVSAHF